MVSKQFITAGDAIFSISCPDGTHHTYRVQHVPANGQWPEAWFVKLFTGSDNSDNRAYTYLGKLDTFTGQVQLTAKSCRTDDHISVRLLNRVLARVWADDHAAYEQHGYATHHEGRCGLCGRRLTVPESIEEGIGPECRKTLGMTPLRTANTPKLAGLAELDERRRRLGMPRIGERTYGPGGGVMTRMGQYTGD